MKAISEADTRALRDQVFGPCTDKNWIEVRQNWMAPAGRRWLRDKAAQPLPVRGPVKPLPKVNKDHTEAVHPYDL